MIYEKGRVCLKIAGREAGNYCVVVEPVDESFVIITGPKEITRVRRRKCNVEHIEPSVHKLNISSGSDADVQKAWNDSGLVEKLNIVLPRFKVKAGKA
ncbi:MAG: 50S ribosomal protein L14e [Nanoarchaeota archaeon]|nr:50S ribosomal protein L14e [Nanoarchaeota archaeon]